MVLDWMRKIHQLEYAHTYESLLWSRIDLWTGISAFAISTLIAFSYQFPSVNSITYESLPFILKSNFFIPFASTIVAILTGLQIFLKPNEKTEVHKNAARQYERLRHSIEIVITTDYTETKTNEKIEGIKKEWEDLTPPSVSPKNFLKGKDKAFSFNKYPPELSFLDDVN